jgi:Amidohydrolase family
MNSEGPSQGGLSFFRPPIAGHREAPLLVNCGGLPAAILSPGAPQTSTHLCYLPSGCRNHKMRSVALDPTTIPQTSAHRPANHGGVAYEGIYASTGGMTNEEALAGLTVHGGRLCGKPDEIGVLKPGAYADILAVEGDPLQDLEALLDVRCVLKGGVEVYPTIEQLRSKPSGGCPKGAYQKTGSKTDLALQDTF